MGYACKASFIRTKRLWKSVEAATVAMYRRLTRKSTARNPNSPNISRVSPNETQDNDNNDTTKETTKEVLQKRDPPARPTELDFPSCSPQGLPQNEIHGNQDLVKAFSTIVREGPSKKHLEALNISVEDNIPLDQLLPHDYIPPPSWSTIPTTAEGYETLDVTSRTSSRLSNNAPVPTRKVFYDAVKELLYDYEDAFRSLRPEKPPLDRPPVRIAYFRKFWDGLLSMASFWDSSADHYFSENLEDPPHNSGVGKKSAVDIDDLRFEAQNADQVKPTVNTERSPSTETRYTGRRIGTGSEMPEAFRNDTIFAFVDTIGGAFRCKLDVAQFQHQKLNMQGMTIGLPMAGSVYRIPKDQYNARKGVKEGPLFGVFPRGQITFRGPRDSLGEGKAEIHDLLWEVALILMLAQKRGREGRSEETPGAGMWWANARRWGGKAGGGLGFSDDDKIEDSTLGEEQQAGQVSEDITDNTVGGAVFYGNQQPTNSSEDDIVDGLTLDRQSQPENVAHDREAAAPRIHHPRPKTRRKAGSWPDVQPPSSSKWEKNIKFCRIERNEGGDPTFPEWYSLRVQRSKWYDLFNTDDRLQVMRAIWAIMGYLMRDDELPDKDVAMTDV
ncbi:hypothetical protein P7C71_g5578, partial [Lecanoromycetidae sp. Uapishka_2]